MAKHATPMLDQLETGPWPSFVSDLKQEAASRANNENNIEFQIDPDAVEDLLGILELSYEHGRCHWKHGGIVGVFGYGGGVIGRYCDQPEKFPGVAHFHTMRVNQPGAKYYTTDFLKKLCDLWEFRGSGITNMHGSTGDIIFIGTTTPQLEEIFFELSQVTRGSAMAIDSRDCLVYSDRGTVAVIGVEGLIVVKTADAVLVVPKERSQEVRRIIAELHDSERDDLL